MIRRTAFIWLILLAAFVTGGSIATPSAVLAADLAPLPPQRGIVRIIVPGDGLELVAYYLLQDNDGRDYPAIIFLHGSENTPAHSISLLRKYNELGFVVLAPSLRGAAGSDYGPLGCRDKAADLFEVVRWLGAEPGVDADRIVIAGGGQGAAVALFAATNDAVAAVVVWNAVTDLARWIETNPHLETSIPFGCGKGGLGRNSPLNVASNVHAPALFIYGEANAAVPPGQSRSMIAAMVAAGHAPEEIPLPNVANRLGDREWRSLWPQITEFLTTNFAAQN